MTMCPKTVKLTIQKLFHAIDSRKQKLQIYKASLYDMFINIYLTAKAFFPQSEIKCL